jgi:hypothetical protein
VRLRHLRGPDIFLLLAVFGVFLPWLVGPATSRSGISQRDGVLVLLLAAGSYLLRQRRVRWTWMVSGFASVVAVRDVVKVLEADGLSVGFGLWLTAGAVILATLGLLWELAGEVASRRAARPPVPR